MPVGGALDMRRFLASASEIRSRTEAGKIGLVQMDVTKSGLSENRRRVNLGDPECIL